MGLTLAVDLREYIYPTSNHVRPLMHVTLRNVLLTVYLKGMESASNMPLDLRSHYRIKMGN